MDEIVFDRVSKTYDPGLFKKKVQAVRNLSLGIPQGEVFGLIGPNGAGKSSTIRLLLGLTRPSSGVIHFRGLPLAQSMMRRDIGYLPENPYLYDNLTLLDLLDFGGRTSGMAAEVRKRRSGQLLERMEMADQCRRPMRTFSKGMRQRAGICYALLHDPSVVILDEPMSGLDPLGRKLLFDLVMDLKSEGKTIFFCSHILSDVERLCDRIGLLVKGTLIKIFEKNQFSENPLVPVHLLVAPLTEAQRSTLDQAGIDITVEAENHLLSLSPERLLSVTELISQMGVAVLGTRSGRVSLESLFLEQLKATGGSR